MTAGGSKAQGCGLPEGTVLPPGWRDATAGSLWMSAPRSHLGSPVWPHCRAHLVLLVPWSSACDWHSQCLYVGQSALTPRAPAQLCHEVALFLCVPWGTDALAELLTALLACPRWWLRCLP